MTKIFSNKYYSTVTIKIKKINNMNLLLTIAAVANPVLTALLTILVFLESKKSKTLIQIDGGVDLNNAKELSRLGADILVSGSCIFSSENPNTIIDSLKKESKV